MNNETVRNHYDAFTRIAEFGAEHGAQFAPGSRGAALFAAITDVAGKMEQHGVKQLAGTGEFRGGTDAKQVAAEELREEMREIRDTAQAISEAEDLPDFDDQFRMPRSYSYEVLLTTARTFLQQATASEALFLEFEMPADFIAQLADAIGALEEAASAQNEGLSSQVGGTAELHAQLTRGISARKMLLPIVRNKFRNDAGIIAQWETAVRIVRPQRKPKSPTPPPDS